MRRILSALPLAGFVLVNSASAATVISTYPQWDGANFVFEFGNGATASPTYGQTFVVPADPYLTSYKSSFAFSGGSEFKFRLYVAPWDDVTSTISSAPLFASPDLTSPNAAAGFKDYTVAMSLHLTPGAKYVAFYSVADMPQAAKGSLMMGLANSDAYAQGGFGYSNAADFSNLSNQAWTTSYTTLDTAFAASFSAAPNSGVPEPASLLALSAGAVALIRRRRAR